jgi:hypothetical protein
VRHCGWIPEPPASQRRLRLLFKSSGEPAIRSIAGRRIRGQADQKIQGDQNATDHEASPRDFPEFFST